MYKHGTFIWNELDTPDQNKCGKFYCKLIGWTKKEVDTSEMGTYTLFQQDGNDVAGMMDPTGPIASPRWNAYIAVENIDTLVSQFGGNWQKHRHQKKSKYESIEKNLYL